MDYYLSFQARQSTRLIEETNIEEAVKLYKQTLEEMYIYEGMETQHSLFGDIVMDLKVGQIEILNRLTINLKKMGRYEELAYEVERYLQIFPEAKKRAGMKPVLKRADRS